MNPAAADRAVPDRASLGPGRPPAGRDSRAPWRLFTVAAVVAGVVWTVTAVLLTSDWLDDRQKQVLSDVMFVVCPLPTIAFCLRAATRATGRLRRSWYWFAGTSAAWALGNMVWFYYQLIADTQPFPTVGDGFYILALVLAAGGLATFPTGRRTREVRPRVLLDALSVVCALLFISDVLVLDEVLGSNLGDGLAAVVYATYPIADVVLASMAVMLLTRTQGFRADVCLIGLALIVYAVADTAFALMGARGQFQIGTPLDLGWVGGYLLLGLAALTPAASTQEDRPLRSAGTNTSATMLVHVPMVLAVVVGFSQPVDDAAEYLLTTGLLVLLVVRQIVLTRDNRRLTEGLEGLVRERTSELEGLSRRYERILDSAAEGIYGVDIEGRITFINAAAARLLGHEEHELVGRHAHAVFHDQESEAAGALHQRCPLADAVDLAQVVRRSDTFYVRRDGRRFPVDLTAAPKFETGDVRGVVVVFSDITERRAMEQMKDEFVSVVSHELRTPLTAIRGSLGLIAGGAVGELPSRAHRMVSIALDNSERLTRLINDILDLERMRSGAIPIDMGIHEATDLVDATLASLGPVALDAGVELVRGPIRGRVHGDADRITQALTNLIGNAVKFSHQGGAVTVWARVERGHVTFAVRDQGRGIPAGKLESIFGRFEQVDSSDTRDHGGTGLGLAITRSIVERHGGEIWVESSPGEGSVFRFTIPAALPVERVEGGGAGDDPDAPRVLVCDDDPQVLEVLGAMLREHGYVPQPAARGRDAVDLAVSGRPDVILMDLRMPGMTGWEAIAELRARPETRDIPIVVMSGLAPEPGARGAAGTDGWVTKPVTDPRVTSALLTAVQGDGEPPRVLVVEDDDGLASVLVELFEREGLRASRAARQSEAGAMMRDLHPDLLVLDLHLLEGDGFGVIADLQHDGRLSQVPVVVYSARDLDEDSRQRLTLGQMSFLTKGHDSPDELARHVVRVIYAMTRHRRVVAPAQGGPGGVPSDSGRR